MMTATCGNELGAGPGAKLLEGWLFLIAARRLKGQFPHKRYFVLEAGVASCFKSKPGGQEEVPIRRGVIDSYTRVADNGRETIHGEVLFAFTIYDSIDNENQLKFGARSAEEAAKWMTAFKVAAEEAQPQGKNGAFVPSHAKRRTSFRKRVSSGLINYPYGGHDLLPAEDAAGVPDWTGALSFKDGSPDVVATSPWRIIGCKNGLHLFMETTDQLGFGWKSMLFKEDQPALMAVGIVNAPCEAIFETAMALGPSRHEWDFCYLRGRVIEHIDGHTDIIHKQFHNIWLPWRMKPRDFILLRYWRREEDGSYVILYRSVKHEKCPPCPGFVRAKLKSGGYVISPLESQSTGQAIVRHMITADWKVWQNCFYPCSEQEVTLRVLERIAAIREVYQARPTGSMCSTTVSTDTLKRIKDPTVSNGIENRLIEQGMVDEATATLQNQDTYDVGHADSPFLQLDEGDEFYDVGEDATWWIPAENLDRSVRFPKEADRLFNDDEKLKDCKSPRLQKLSAAATIVKRLHELANNVQKKNQNEVGFYDESEAELFHREGSLPKRSETVLSCCWDVADVDTFLIRGKKYLSDNQKVKAGEPWMQFVLADWLMSDKREDHLAGRPSNVVQRLTAKFQRVAPKARPPHFFVINLQVPGSTTYSLSLYYMTFRKLEDDPLLEKFVNADGLLDCETKCWQDGLPDWPGTDYELLHRSNYIELDVDIGSSSVAKGVVNLVLGYLSKLVIEMAFLIQADTEEELPEHLLGTCRLSYLDIKKAAPASAD